MQFSAHMLHSESAEGEDMLEFKLSQVSCHSSYTSCHPAVAAQQQWGVPGEPDQDSPGLGRPGWDQLLDQEAAAPPVAGRGAVPQEEVSVHRGLLEVLIKFSFLH